MSNHTEPKLAPPGAGLPFPESIIARMMIGFQRLRYDRLACIARFEAEQAGIRALVDKCPVALRGKQVLIARARGLEDSSRNWSVWMTLDHLRITNDAFRDIICSLVNGVTPAKPARTEDVKPDPAVSAEIEGRYEQSCSQLLQAVNELTDLKTKLKFPHPWFGPMDATGWHTLSAGHMAIHREQIRRILAGL